MFYNVPIFPVKSAFYIEFIASLLLIKLIIQRYSEPLIFKIAILLRFIDIISKSLHLLHLLVETQNKNLTSTNSDKYRTLLMHLFY